jgi:hypothetical protein
MPAVIESMRSRIDRSIPEKERLNHINCVEGYIRDNLGLYVGSIFGGAESARRREVAEWIYYFAIANAFNYIAAAYKPPSYTPLYELPNETQRDMTIAVMGAIERRFLQPGGSGCIHTETELKGFAEYIINLTLEKLPQPEKSTRVDFDKLSALTRENMVTKAETVLNQMLPMEQKVVSGEREAYRRTIGLQLCRTILGQLWLEDLQNSPPSTSTPPPPQQPREQINIAELAETIGEVHENPPYIKSAAQHVDSSGRNILTIALSDNRILIYDESYSAHPWRVLSIPPHLLTS